MDDARYAEAERALANVVSAWEAVQLGGDPMIVRLALLHDACAAIAIGDASLAGEVLRHPQAARLTKPVLAALRNAGMHGGSTGGNSPQIEHP